jgi:hypothetical protein
VIVKGAVAVALGIGVTGEVTNRVAPAGAVPTHDADNVTAELNPSMEPTVTVAEPLSPCVNMTFEVDVSEKSCEVAVELVLVVVWLVNEKVAVAKSLPGLPIAVMVYEPTATFVAIKEPDNAPFEIEQVEKLTTLPVSEQLESPEEKPDPET